MDWTLDAYIITIFRPGMLTCVHLRSHDVIHTWCYYVLMNPNNTWCQKWFYIEQEVMATLNINPPKQFNFNNPDDWPWWKKWLQHFCDASGLSLATEKCQISTILYCLGEEADDVLLSTNITEEQEKKHADVLAKFDEHFKVRENLSFLKGQSSTSEFNWMVKVPRNTLLLCII